MSLNLHYRLSGSGKPILLLHGLFGAGNNLSALGRKLAEAYQVFQPDLRNHGNSPHSTEMDYELMAEDIMNLIRDHNLQEITLIGHSMGGKVAMVLALKHPSLIERLFVLDIAPVQYTHAYGKLFNAMRALPLEIISSRTEAEAQLDSLITDLDLTRFLLQNLVKKGTQYKWRMNLESLEKNIAHIGAFPELNTTLQDNKPVHFIGGINSEFIHPDYHDAIFRYFPGATIEFIHHAGHMLHIEQPESLLTLIINHLKGNQIKKMMH